MGDFSPTWLWKIGASRHSKKMKLLLLACLIASALSSTYHNNTGYHHGNDLYRRRISTENGADYQGINNLGIPQLTSTLAEIFNFRLMPGDVQLINQYDAESGCWGWPCSIFKSPPIFDLVSRLIPAVEGFMCNQWENYDQWVQEVKNYGRDVEKQLCFAKNVLLARNGEPYPLDWTDAQFHAAFADYFPPPGK